MTTPIRLRNIRDGYAEIFLGDRQIGAVERLKDCFDEESWYVQPEGWWRYLLPEYNPDNNFGVFFNGPSFQTRREAVAAAIEQARKGGLL